jgi:ribosomal protein L34
MKHTYQKENKMGKKELGFKINETKSGSERGLDSKTL